MAHPDSNFLIGRRLLLTAAPAFLAFPALAKLGPELLTGGLARFTLAKEAKPLPELAFTDADDKPLSLADYKGKTVLLNFWATWCGPCVKEMPSLDRLQAKFGRQRLVVLPLSLDGASRAKVAPFYENAKLKNLDIWFDKGRVVMKTLKVSILPTTILIDAQGREVARLEGELEWDAEDAIALVSSFVAS